MNKYLNFIRKQSLGGHALSLLGKRIKDFGTVLIEPTFQCGKVWKYGGE